MADDIEVRPNGWVNSNRKGFLDWTYKTFHPSNYATQKSLFPHQRFVRDFLQFKSPYRGLLLYHQLGTGKTATSISAAEVFVRNNKKIIVMIPASLANNYKAEIMNYASIGMPRRKMWAELDVSEPAVAKLLDLEPKYIRSLKPATTVLYPVTMIPQGFPENAIQRTNLTWASLSTDEQEGAKSILTYFIEKKYEFINYNGLTKKGEAIKRFNDAIATPDAFVIIDEAHNFISRVVNTGKLAREVYDKIMQARTATVVLLSGTPVINHPFEVAMMVNLVRGIIDVNVYTVTKTGKMPTDSSEVSAVLEAQAPVQYKDIDEIMVDVKNRKIKIVFKPNTKSTTEKRVSEVLNKEFKISKTKTPNEYGFALPMDKPEFEKMFLDLSKPDDPKSKNMELFTRRVIGLVSYLSTIGEEYFPKIQETRVERVPMSKFQFDKYAKERHREREMDSRKRRNDNNVLGGKTSVYRAFSRMTSNFVFPDDISRPYPGTLRQLAKNEIDASADGEDEAVYGDDAGSGSGSGSDSGSAKKKPAVDIKQEYEKAITKALKQLKKESDVYLNGDELADKYSPKMARILKDVESSPGKVLLYSQFRTVEGLGVMKLILEQAGWVEVKCEVKEDQWQITNAEEVLDPKYDNKRFITFDIDRSKAEVLKNLFNGSMNVIPPSLRDVANTNLYGELIKLILITQSGAEGISLKCVRRVLITEPFWNMVRLDQVIGRAVRANSHIDLPENERNVSVHIYTSTFTKQMEEDFTIKTQDKKISTDIHILRIAQKKDKLNQIFLKYLKAAAVDCRIHAAKNKPLANGFQCYAFPLPYDDNELAYHAHITRDVVALKEIKNRMRRSKIKGQVVSKPEDPNKKYVVVDKYPGKLFDYDAYKDAGVLVVV